ncbi:ATP-binding cassette domain-containing protein [Raineyella sp.]|uniref:ATP-binding cassette domain-containing protein n=1 Tax=Raineyella sp. TaxID=1911550 RepID=UPI002B1FA8D2|nr:ATP-binding cassette domain-containing protein [Raineyella sp.]MEA5155886.1 ATP-binding cassette domain-containing protein [Raineyella sp.]
MTTEPLAIRARDLLLESSRGTVYGPVDLDVPAGRLLGLVSPEGGGRTSLLLTLAGRMRFSSGSLQVFGHPLPRATGQAQRHSALANFADIDDLDDGLTPREILTERAGLLAPLWRRVPRWQDPQILATLELAFGERPIPDPDVHVWELSPLDTTLLQIAIALMGDPLLLVVDDIDALHHPSDQLTVWRTLQRLTDGSTTVPATYARRAAPEGRPPLTVIASAAAPDLMPPEVDWVDPHGTIPAAPDRPDHPELTDGPGTYAAGHAPDTDAPDDTDTPDTDDLDGAAGHPTPGLTPVPAQEG